MAWCFIIMGEVQIYYKLTYNNLTFEACKSLRSRKKYSIETLVFPETNGTCWCHGVSLEKSWFPSVRAGVVSGVESSAKRIPSVRSAGPSCAKASVGANAANLDERLMLLSLQLHIIIKCGRCYTCLTLCASMTIIFRVCCNVNVGFDLYTLFGSVREP